ncbi:helix-turn-helix domain-containing protein [Nocardia transvalensis]|uniref:helix-turn-helix domain-containing protein n=1 Tax=Nocardia transvalensis TaxID=37333 RepID=UPI00189498F3|nr:helix-turn-helix domain-containing protein [Nocardia transvalensis]MBF6333517.1 helix-turn-helix domain-containing protein [Nocardia transvalensis]
MTASRPVCPAVYSIARPTKVTPIPSSLPRHGKYKTSKIRICRAAHGIPARVPEAEVRAHIQTLRSWGFTDTAIAAAAGVSQKTVWLIRHGTYPTSQIDRAARLMTVTHIPVPAQAGLMVPNIGTSRRLHALMAIGWPQRRLAARLGVSQAAVHQYTIHRWVRYETWRAICDLYEELSGTPGPSPSLAKQSRDRGFAPPLLWDGLDIDHPAHEPAPDETTEMPGIVDEVLLLRILRGEHTGEISRAERQAVLDHAVEHGWTQTKLAEVLNIHRGAAARALARHRAKRREAA